MAYLELSLGTSVLKVSAKRERRKTAGCLGDAVSPPAGTGQSPVGGQGEKFDDLLLKIDKFSRN